MKVVYVDTSVLVSIFFDEPGLNAQFIKAMEQADQVVSSILIQAEFLATIRREQVDLNEGIEFLKPISLIVPDRSLTREIKQVLSKAYVRGADAFHLACALYLDPSAKSLTFLTADVQQQKAAEALGLKS